jgi:hypothetical protein
MKVSTTYLRLLALLVCIVLAIALLPVPQAQAKTVAQWLEGFRTGKDWFDEGYKYDITDEAWVWEQLMKPITVLDVAENESVYPLVEPGGKKVNNDKLGGFINGASAAVHVLGEDEGGWTLIEGLDYYNRIIKGYVKTRLLKQVTPNEHYGVVIDKLTQRLYVFIDGKFFSSVAISTGLPNDQQPYNETSAGEYLTISWSGGFDSEGMYCDMAIRFNSGDKIHEVPCTILADGTKRYTKWEAQLGQKASHGCVRVARLPNDEGLNQKWLWDNLKRMTKVLIWDDAGRLKPYPDDGMLLYYNPNGGKYYHSTPECSGVKKKFYPLTAFTYAELDTGIYAALEPCPSCTPVKRKALIDAENIARGAITQAELDALHAQETATPAPSDTHASSLSEMDDAGATTPPTGPTVDETGVEVIIIRKDDATN